MILGYEDPVQMPTMDIYSTDLMKTYIAGVKDLYDKGQQEYKDFMKAYQDFYSPIAGDTEAYYNYTIGGAQKLLDQFYQNGIDPFKSREGRAAITRYINSVPVGALNAMKQNAENRKAYDKAKAELEARGLYNKALEDSELERLGLSNFNTVGPDGQINTWDRLSPLMYKSMLDLTSPTFQKYAPIKNLRKSETNPFYDVFGVSDQDKAVATNAAARELLSGPYGQFYRNVARQEVLQSAQEQGLSLSPEELENATDQRLMQNIQFANNEYLQEKDVLAQDRLKLAEMREHARQQALNRQNAANIAAQQQQQPMGFVDSIRTIVSDNVNRATGNSSPANPLSALREIYNYFTSKGLNGNAQKEIKSILESEGQEQYTKLKTFLKRKGYIDENDIYTDDYYKWYNKAVTSNYNLNWNNYTFAPPTQQVRTDLLNLIADPSNNSASNDPSGIKRWNVRQGTLKQTLANRQRQIDGKVQNTIGKKFITWLNGHNNVYGYLDGTGSITSVGVMPTQYNTNTIDVNSNYKYKVSDIKTFLDENNISEDDFLKATGGSIINDKGTTIKWVDQNSNVVKQHEKAATKGAIYPIVKKYYIIPMTDIVDVNSLNQSFIDSSYDKAIGGVSNTWKILSERQTNSLNQ